MKQALAALLLLVAAAAAAQENVPVVFSVMRTDGAPVAGAEVRVQEQTATTGANGTATINLPLGSTTRVDVTPPPGSGLAIDYVNGVQIERDMTVRFDLVRQVRISGRVVNPSRIRAENQIQNLGRPWSEHFPLAPDGTFAVDVPAGVYAIHSMRFSDGFAHGQMTVDARNGDVANAVVTLRDGGSPVPTKPPRAALITVSAPGERDLSTVSGAPGAVEPLSSVVVGNLMTRQISITVSGADGSFSAPMYAPPGAAIQIKQDPSGLYLPHTPFNGTINEIGVPPGTIIHVPVPPASSGVAIGTGGALSTGKQGNFGTLARIGHIDAGQWWIRGTMETTTWAPSQRISGSGTIDLRSRDFDAAFDPSTLSTLGGGFVLERLFDPSGRAFTDSHQFLSSVMTPTGLPIELQGNVGGGGMRISNLRLVEPGLVRGDFTLEGQLPSTLPPGLYRPRVHMFRPGMATRRHRDVFPQLESLSNGELPLVRVGEPGKQRLFWMLAADTFSNGSRGAVAEEDRGRFAFASHVLMNANTLILPKEDAKTRRALTYRLEPFAPMIANSTARLVRPPQIPFRFPSGSLTVRVQKPDGSVDDLGSAPFAQSTSRTPAMRSGPSISGATNTVTDLFQLTTLDPRFDYTFTQYGRHLVTMTGTVDDIYGNRYEGGGTYEVWIARTLDFETAVTPGTPFEVGDVFSPALVLQPPVPAEVQWRVRLGTIERTLDGRANRFGFFGPDHAPIVMSAPGEYRADVTVRHTDADGVLWMGTATWGNVVETPGSPHVTRGRRGFDLVNAIQQQWFRVREARAGGDHVMYPFHRGDVMWMQKDDPAADIPKVTVQDGDGTFGPRVLARTRFNGHWEQPTIQERITAGEIPLFSTSSQSITTAGDPDNTDQWGYFYAFAERPGVRVREFISEDESANGYWRFHDVYNFQQGNGANGDLPNDFKFQFGGSVWREGTFAHYGAYASLFVLLPLNDAEGGRVFPPFQGNGGGPSGGPIMRLKGKDIDAFFHPTGVRAGTILEKGNRVSFAGQLAPTLPGNVEIVVRAPSGRERTITARANKIGWWYRPSFDFDADEVGVWTARIRVTFDGTTSAGALSAPFPTGDVLGSRGGELWFYVVDPISPPLETTYAKSTFLEPNVNPTVFHVPAGTRATVTMPGFILDERVLSGALTLDLNALRADFPNLDPADFDGHDATETITISLFANGRARQLVFLGEELVAMPQKVGPRRRVGVRRP